MLDKAQKEIEGLMKNRDGASQNELDCVVEIIHKPLKEKGEDSFAYNVERDDVQTQAVFDGCGGAGSWQYTEYRNATGAFIAAQSMARAYLEWFDKLPSSTFRDTEKTEESFAAMARHILTDLKQHCAPMKVSGTMVKSFPCTASVAFSMPDTDSVLLSALNVGDSRVYFLTPNKGLIQLTTDDSQGDPDPMESLRDSAPLSDMLNADNPFKIKSCQVRLSYPCAVVTATDGVFGYVRSPMDFEYLLLHSIICAGSFAHFEELFKDAIVKVTGDDSTCLISFYGWGSFENVKRMLSNRYKHVSSLISGLNESKNEKGLEYALNEIWNDYRKQTLFDEIKG